MKGLWSSALLMLVAPVCLCIPSGVSVKHADMGVESKSLPTYNLTHEGKV